MKINHSLNAQIKDDYHLGYQLEHDLTKIEKCEGVLAMKNEKGDFFVKSDCLSQVVTLGCHHAVAKAEGHWHSYELAYDIKGDTIKAEDGIQGHPVTLTIAGEKELTPDVRASMKFDVGKNIISHNTIT
jgi:hypothetical protein